MWVEWSTLEHCIGLPSHRHLEARLQTPSVNAVLTSDMEDKLPFQASNLHWWNGELLSYWFHLVLHGCIRGVITATENESGVLPIHESSSLARGGHWTQRREDL